MGVQEPDPPLERRSETDLIAGLPRVTDGLGSLRERSEWLPGWHTELLAEAAAALARPGELEQTLHALAACLVRWMADWCVVDLFAPEGDIRRIAAVHGDPARQPLLDRLVECFPPRSTGPDDRWNLLRSGHPILVVELSDAVLARQVEGPEYAACLRELGAGSYLAVPMAAGECVFGAIGLVRARPGAYGPEDVALAGEVARRTALFLQGALRSHWAEWEIARSRRLEAELTEVERRRERFLAILAHELRNPIAAISGAQYLIERASDDPRIRRLSAIIGRQVRHLSRLVEDLLEAARASEGKLELRKEPVELCPAVLRVAEVLRPRMERENLTLSVEFPEPLWVEADPTRLDQILINLLENAVKYNRPGGSIRIRAEREADRVALSIRDTGRGIAPHAIERVFDLFVQASEGTAGAREGLGIGLSVVKTLVELHGGSVEAQSEGPGRGSEFTVRLPAAQAPPVAPAEEGTPGPTVLVLPSRPPVRVLVADDHEDALVTLAELLAEHGCRVWVARDGPAALREAREFRPDVVLLDLDLPGIDGLEVARRLRETEGERVRLVAVSGFGQEEIRRRCAEAGFDGYLQKPFDPEALLRLVCNEGTEGAAEAA